jgi:hypothetical protein
MKNKEVLAGLSILGLCALCCTIPLMVGGAAIVGISSFFLDPVWIGLLAAVVIGIGFLLFRKRSQACTTCHTSGQCKCKSK